MLLKSEACNFAILSKLHLSWVSRISWKKVGASEVFWQFVLVFPKIFWRFQALAHKAQALQELVSWWMWITMSSTGVFWIPELAGLQMCSNQKIGNKSPKMKPALNKYIALSGGGSWLWFRPTPATLFSKKFGSFVGKIPSSHVSRSVFCVLAAGNTWMNDPKWSNYLVASLQEKGQALPAQHAMIRAHQVMKQVRPWPFPHLGVAPPAMVFRPHDEWGEGYLRSQEIQECEVDTVDRSSSFFVSILKCLGKRLRLTLIFGSIFTAVSLWFDEYLGQMGGFNLKCLRNWKVWSAGFHNLVGTCAGGWFKLYLGWQSIFSNENRGTKLRITPTIGGKRCSCPVLLSLGFVSPNDNSEGPHFLSVSRSMFSSLPWGKALKWMSGTRIEGEVFEDEGWREQNRGKLRKKPWKLWGKPFFPNKK